MSEAPRRRAVADYSLQALEPEDAGVLRQLAELDGRNLHAEEYDRFLRLEGAGGWVLLKGGTPIAAVTTMQCFAHGVLGPVLSVGELAAGLETVLLSHAVETLLRGGSSRVEAEATARESETLTRMGFGSQRATLVLERAPGAAPLPRATEAVPMEVRHLLDVGILDAAAVGHGRKEFIAALRDTFPEGAFVVERDDSLAGFVVMRRSRRGYHIGPLVTAGDDDAVALDLVRSCVARAASWPVTILVPDARSRFVETLAAEGFVEVARLDRLRAGDAPTPPEAREWAVGSRITG